MSTIDSLNALSPDELRVWLSGPDAAAFVRAAAEAGSAEAQAWLGQILLDTGDAAEGFGWFVRAARAGHVEAINMVGRCYDLGWGVAVDKIRAAEWFRAAAYRGLHWGMYNYATALALGAGVVEDRAKALLWFERAAEHGNAKAVNFIGSFHEDGWGVRQNMPKAAGYYARAAEGGDFRGAFNHARMLAEAGKMKRALYWLARAAERGNARFRAQVTEWLDARAEPELRDAAALFA